MIRYLFWLLTRVVFLGLVVPGVFVGTFYLLVVEAGLSPRLVEVWGLAVLGGTLVLLGLKPIEALITKIRGPQDPPELPRWAKLTLTTGGVGLGLAGASGVAIGLLIFATVGSWWPITGPKMLLGNVALVHDTGTGAGANLHRLSFSPAHGDRKAGTKDLEVTGEVLAFELRRVRFSGVAAKVTAQLEFGDRVWPGDVLVKGDAAFEHHGVAGSLLPPPGYTSLKVLEFLKNLPGVEVDVVRTEYVAVGPQELSLELAGSQLAIGGAQEIPDPPPEPTKPPRKPPPRPTPKPVDPGGPGDPGGGDPVPPPEPTEAPATGWASPAEIALLHPDDPFEGLD